MSNLTEALENGCCCRCECGQFHSSTIKAVTCDGCIEVLTSEEHSIRRVHALMTGEVIWEAPLLRHDMAEDEARMAREAVADEDGAKAAIHPAPLTYNPFAALS